MSRRHDDQAFGSDSFLDIVANVVGILIILIVVAGVRVGRMPVLAITPPAPTQPDTVVAEPQSLEEMEPVLVAESEPEPVFFAPVVEAPPVPPKPRVIVVEKPLPELAAPQAPAELVSRSEALRRAIAQLETNRTRLDRELKSVDEQAQLARADLQQREETAAAKAAVAARQARQEQDDLAAGERELTATREQLERLKQMLAEADSTPAATPIQHRVTPIGRAVTGHELHFHLSEGRVAYVPIDELARRLRAQIDRQKALYAKVDRYEGAIDPLDGFRMNYVIERSQLSLQEELRYGKNIIRMQVSKWVLQPEPNLQSESAEQALQKGSSFYQSLLAAGPTATLTFWVYPDSFELCAQLKAFAQQLGYDVAARPLPFGVPIAGSPDGSKSIAQ